MGGTEHWKRPYQSLEEYQPHESRNHAIPCHWKQPMAPGIIVGVNKYLGDKWVSYSLEFTQVDINSFGHH